MKRAMAYGKAVAERRRSGERIGLLVVSLHGWDDGKWFESSPEVCRVMLPADLAVDDADWSICLALDVLLCGTAPDDLFREAALACMRHGAVSCWGEFADGIHRLASTPMGAVVSVDGPFPIRKLGSVLNAFRPVAIALGLGGYGSKMFDAVHAAMFGDLVVELQAALSEGA